jgi:hypothetical protein
MRRLISASSLPELRSLLAFQVIRTRGFLSWFVGSCTFKASKVFFGDVL